MSGFIGIVSTGDGTWVNGIQYRGSPISTSTRTLDAEHQRGKAVGRTTRTLSDGRVVVERISRVGGSLMQATITFANEHDAAEVPGTGKDPQTTSWSPWARRTSQTASSSKSQSSSPSVSARRPSISKPAMPAVASARSAGRTPVTASKGGQSDGSQAVRVRPQAETGAPPRSSVGLTASQTKAEKLARLRGRQAYLAETVRLGAQLQVDLASLQKEREHFDKEYEAIRALLLKGNTGLTAEASQDRMTRISKMLEWKNRLEDKEKEVEASFAVLKARK